METLETKANALDIFFKELIVGQVSRRSSGVGKKDSTRLKTTASKAPARRVWSSPCALISKTSPSLSYSIYSGNSEPIHQVQMEYWSWNFSLHFFDSLLKCRTSWTTAIIIEKPKSMQIVFACSCWIACFENSTWSPAKRLHLANSEPWYAVICSDIPNTSIRNHPTAPGFSIQKCTEWYWMTIMTMRPLKLRFHCLRALLQHVPICSIYSRFSSIWSCKKSACQTLGAAGAKSKAKDFASESQAP